MEELIFFSLLCVSTEHYPEDVSNFADLRRIQPSLSRKLRYHFLIAKVPLIVQGPSWSCRTLFLFKGYVYQWNVFLYYSVRLRNGAHDHGVAGSYIVCSGIFSTIRFGCVNYPAQWCFDESTTLSQWALLRYTD